jgi:hypothetical protein
MQSHASHHDPAGSAALLVLVLGLVLLLLLLLVRLLLLAAVQGCCWRFRQGSQKDQLPLPLLLVLGLHCDCCCCCWEVGAALTGPLLLLVLTVQYCWVQLAVWLCGPLLHQPAAAQVLVPAAAAHRGALCSCLCLVGVHRWLHSAYRCTWHV